MSRQLFAIVEKFNRNLKFLINSLVQIFPQDVFVLRLRKRVSTAISFDPQSVIAIVGEQLSKFGEQIYSRNVKFFLERSYNKLEKSDDDERAEISRNIIPLIKQSYSTLSEEEKEDLMDLVVEMLDCYMDYICETED